MTDFSHAEATPPVLHSFTLLRFGIGFSQGFAFAGIEIKTMYPSQNNLEQRKRKNKDYNKNASENKNCLSKAKNASDQMERLRPSEAFRFFLPFCFARYQVSIGITLDSRLHPPQKTGSPF